MGSFSRKHLRDVPRSSPRGKDAQRPSECPFRPGELPRGGRGDAKVKRRQHALNRAFGRALYGIELGARQPRARSIEVHQCLGNRAITKKAHHLLVLEISYAFSYIRMGAEVLLVVSCPHPVDMGETSDQSGVRIIAFHFGSARYIKCSTCPACK